MAEEKTNVMRMLEQAGVPYRPHGYAHGKEHVDGMTVASVDVNQLGDLTIRFANGATLLALAMRSDDDECWRFWNDDLWPDQHMVVYGDHVELHGPGDGCCGICE